MAAPETIRLFGTVTDSIVDGPGLRFSVFVQGCSHECPGCHNEGSWPFEGGTESTIDQLMERIFAHKIDRNLTLSGGDPFEQAAACAEVARRAKAQGYNIWIYSGSLYEDLLKRAETDADVCSLLETCDVLVDGPFVKELRSLGLLYRGSSNQRLIDLVATRKAGAVVCWEKKDEFPTKPASW